MSGSSLSLYRTARFEHPRMAMVQPQSFQLSFLWGGMPLGYKVSSYRRSPSCASKPNPPRQPAPQKMLQPSTLLLQSGGINNSSAIVGPLLQSLLGQAGHWDQGKLLHFPKLPAFPKCHRHFQLHAQHWIKWRPFLLHSWTIFFFLWAWLFRWICYLLRVFFHFLHYFTGGLFWNCAGITSLRGAESFWRFIRGRLLQGASMASFLKPLLPVLGVHSVPQPIISVLAEHLNIAEFLWLRRGRKTFASLLESWGVPLSLMLHLPRSSHPTAATTAHQLCLSSRHRLLLSYSLFLHQQTPSLKHLFPFHCVKCRGRDIFLCTNATSSK